jgi:hypothetical protein
MRDHCTFVHLSGAAIVRSENLAGTAFFKNLRRIASPVLH